MSISAVALAVGMQIAGCPPVIEDVQSIQPVPGWSVSVRKYPRRLDRVMLYTEEPSKLTAVADGMGHSASVNSTAKFGGGGQLLLIAPKDLFRLFLIAAPTTTFTRKRSLRVNPTHKDRFYEQNRCDAVAAHRSYAATVHGFDQWPCWFGVYSCLGRGLRRSYRSYRR